jgi:putative transcriptional regulator
VFRQLIPRNFKQGVGLEARPEPPPVKNALRELRTERGWSQGDLADRLAVSRQTVNAIETEKYDPSLPLAFKIASLFKLPIEEIFSPSDRNRAARRK